MESTRTTTTPEAANSSTAQAYLRHIEKLPPEVKGEIQLFDLLSVAMSNILGLWEEMDTAREMVAGNMDEALKDEPELLGAVKALHDAGVC